MAVFPMVRGGTVGGGSEYKKMFTNNVTETLDFEPDIVIVMRYDGILDVYDKSDSATTYIQYNGSNFATTETITLNTNNGLLRNISGNTLTLYPNGQKLFVYACKL